MKTAGTIVLIAWIALIVFSMVMPFVRKGPFYRWLFKRRRKLQLVILSLMITWIMLLTVSGLFKID